MADTFRYRYGDTSPVVAGAKTGIAFSVGDLCYRDASDGFTAKPASSLAWAGSLAATQAVFAPLFLGVSGERWDGVNLPTGNKTGFFRFLTLGTFAYACAAGSSFNFGDYVAPDAASNLLLPQQVIKTLVQGSAIGKVAKSVVNVSEVLIQIYTAIFSPPVSV